MPYSRPFVKIRIQGTLGASALAPVENWSTGFNIIPTGGGSTDPANLLAYLTSIQGAVSTFHAAANAKVGSSCWLTKLTAAYIGVDGKYVLGSLQPTTVYTYGTPVAGNGTVIHSFSTALVTSLRSLRLRGPASHGRMYYPATAMTVQSTDGTVSSASLALYVPLVKTLIDAANSSAASVLGTGSRVSLVSKVGSGADAVVTSIMVDQKLDQMESRERSVVSAYTTLVPAGTSLYVAERDEELRRRYQELEDQAPNP